MIKKVVSVLSRYNQYFLCMPVFLSFKSFSLLYTGHKYKLFICCFEIILI
jgi:hypothetical protein